MECMLPLLLDLLRGRRPGPDRRLPRWLREALDETFLWEAVGELLIATGVRPLSASRLAEVRRTLEEVRSAFDAMGHPVPRLEGMETVGDLESFQAGWASLSGADPEGIRSAIPAPQAVRWGQGAGRIVAELAEETLAQLRGRGIRTELVGLDHDEALASVHGLHRLAVSHELRRAADDGYPSVERWFEEADEVSRLEDIDPGTRPLEPEEGEVERIIEVIRAVPKPTLKRLLPSSLLVARPVLRFLIPRGLSQLRTSWVPPEERGTPSQAGTTPHGDELADG